MSKIHFGEPMKRLVRLCPVIGGAALCHTALAGTLAVTSVQPPLNAGNVPPRAAISVTFDRPLNTASVTSARFWAFGRWSGAAEGAITFSNRNHTATLTPHEQFSAGESVMVILSHDVQAADGSPLRAAGYSWQFTVRAGPGNLSFSQVQSLSARTFPGTAVRSYGGIASDLNNDGWLDITLVNEVSADLRVFMNSGNGNGTFGSFLTPTNPVGSHASPSEPSDFNRDGFTDIAVANTQASSVSVLLGNGNGSYGPQQLIGVGSNPRGIAVLDFDGDGDIDIVNTNAASNNISRMTNNGSGVFSGPTYWQGGADGEWGLAAGDMDEDGVLDLAIGAQNSQQVVIHRGNGDGTFTHIETESSGGQVWMLNVADVNGDGHNDVITANGLSNNAARMLGDGTGALGAAAVVAVEPWAIGSDLGDLDGDGDADWIVSSYNGDWRLYRNNGSGTFTFHQEFNSPQAASCALFFDVENDGDLDLGLIDELADVVITMRNGGIATEGDVNSNGVVNVQDLLAVIGAWGPCGGGGDPCHEDVTGDGVVNVADLLRVIANWG